MVSSRDQGLIQGAVASMTKAPESGHPSGSVVLDLTYACNE